MSAAGKKTKFLLWCSCLISCTTIPTGCYSVQADPEPPFLLETWTRDKIICLNSGQFQEIMKRSKEDMLKHQKIKERKENSQHQIKTKFRGGSDALHSRTTHSPQTVLSSRESFHCNPMSLQRLECTMTAQGTEEKSFKQGQVAHTSESRKRKKGLGADNSKKT